MTLDLTPLRRRILDQRRRILDLLDALATDEPPAGPALSLYCEGRWFYPRFQFDPEGRPFPEIQAILAALAPDDQGWDRLQWFLEEHEKLDGRRPLDVWQTDRRAVVAAAAAERWNGRD